MLPRYLQNLMHIPMHIPVHKFTNTIPLEIVISRVNDLIIDVF